MNCRPNMIHRSACRPLSDDCCACGCTAYDEYCLTPEVIRMNISALQEVIREINVEKGWYDRPVSFGELIALIHSECSEALEEYRIMPDGDDAEDMIMRGMDPRAPLAEELADVLIRTLDTASRMGIILEPFVMAKLEKNRKREYRHGGKKL